MGDYLSDYPELCSYANIKYTPAWYYKEFPGFFNVESYRILANWQQGVRTEEQYEADMKESLAPVSEEEDGVEEMKENECVFENKKRKLEDEKPCDL